MAIIGHSAFVSNFVAEQPKIMVENEEKALVDSGSEAARILGLRIGSFL